MPSVEPGALRERLEALPGLERLLAVLDGLPPAYLVGGAVRDILRGAASVDLDVAIEGDGPSAAREIAARLGGEVREHGRFATATVRAGVLVLDVAATRRERYREPGALPEVEPAGLGADLARRDFSVNAMAVGLSGEDRGTLHDPHRGREDLEAGVIRVLHAESFRDDATRVLRALRYEARLDSRMDEETEALARRAVADAMLDTVAGTRVRDELLDLLQEAEAPSAVARMGELGADRGLHPGLRADPELVASAALGCVETGADRALAGLAALAADTRAEGLGPWLDRAGFRAAERDAVVRAAEVAGGLVARLPEAERPSDLHALLAREPPEALALALALGAPAEPVLRFSRELRGVRLEIDGGDLLAAGVPEGPAVGRGLAGALAAKLDGRVSGRDAEIRAALEAAR